MKYIDEGDKIVAVNDDGERVGVIEFKEGEGNSWIAYRTFVKHSFRGKGIAHELLNHLTIKAQKEGRKIIPQCDFVLRNYEEI